jgi:hypothetical protein
MVLSGTWEQKIANRYNFATGDLLLAPSPVLPHFWHVGQKKVERPAMVFFAMGVAQQLHG